MSRHLICLYVLVSKNYYFVQNLISSLICIVANRFHTMFKAIILKYPVIIAGTSAPSFADIKSKCN